MKKDYSDAYGEVLEVLKYIPREDYNKIPKKTINLLEQSSNEKSAFTYNIALPFDKQELSKDAKVILAILFRNCWITVEEKKELMQNEKEQLEKIEQEKREKYNPENLFEKREKEIVKELEENHYLAVQEKWYEKILSKLKNLFKKQH